MMSQNSLQIKAEQIEKILIDLGYDLSDKGSYWQTNAVYRNGDNKTAIQIWKNSGIWKDYVANTPYQPFKKLLEISCSDDNKIEQFLKESSDENLTFNTYSKTPKMQAEAFFNQDEITTLIPHFSFYNNKKISDDTLHLYQSGFAMSGRLNGRMVFPILNENKKIIGLSGRHLLWNQSSMFSKWKHLGRKSCWIYPIHMSDKNIFAQATEDKQEIILVEGIGDSLALTEQKIYNHLVLFGLDISSKQMSYLLSLQVKKIIIATNNDANKQDNRGLKAAIKLYAKLAKYFDPEKIEIRLPILKDFGEMLENNICISKWENKKVNKIKQIEYILKEVYDNKKEFYKFNTDILENYLERLNIERNTISQ